MHNTCLTAQKLDQESLQGMAEFSNEIRLSRSVSHPNIVRLLGYTSEGVAQCLIYELLTGGNLEERLRGKVRHLADAGKACNSSRAWVAARY